MLDLCIESFSEGAILPLSLMPKKKPPTPTNNPTTSTCKIFFEKSYEVSHLAPSIYLLEMSGLCGRRTYCGNAADFKKHLRWWLRFEGNLRNLFAYYATRGWELSPEERLSWDDVTTNNTTIHFWILFDLQQTLTYTQSI